MPLGLEPNLEYMTIHDADFGATRNHKMSPDPSNSSMVVIECERRKEKLDELGWAGFSSANIGDFKPDKG